MDRTNGLRIVLNIRPYCLSGSRARSSEVSYSRRNRAVADGTSEGSLAGICRSPVHLCHESAPSPTSKELVTGPRAYRYTMAASQDTTDILRNATFSQPDGPAASVTAADLLLGGAYDPAKLHPMSGLSDNLDYLLLEDDKVNELPGSGTAVPSRGWSDDLCYGTGTMYLTGPFSFPSSFISHLLPSHFGLLSNPVPIRFVYSISFTLALSSILLFSFVTCAHSCSPGLGVGGVWGLREGVRRPIAVSNTRLRINSILNSVTRRGTFIGNSAGVLGTPIQRLVLSAPDSYPRLALVYNGINSSIDHWRGRHDAAGSMVAGALTGVIYKSTGACFCPFP